MAANDLIKQLSKQPPAVKIGILAGAILLFGAIYWQFFYSELSAKKSAASAKNSSLIKKAESLAKKKEDLAKLVEQRDALNKELDRIQLALPSEAELTSFVQHLQTKAGEARVAFNWASKKEVSIGEYIKVPLAVTAAGTFHQLTHYFYLLGPYGAQAEDQANSGRIVTIDNLNIKTAKSASGEVMLTAKFTASTFRKEAPREK